MPSYFKPQTTQIGRCTWWGLVVTDQVRRIADALNKTGKQTDLAHIPYMDAYKVVWQEDGVKLEQVFMASVLTTDVDLEWLTEEVLTKAEQLRNSTSRPISSQEALEIISRPRIGGKRTLQNIQDAMMEFFHRHYRQPNILLVNPLLHRALSNDASVNPLHKTDDPPDTELPNIVTLFGMRVYTTDSLTDDAFIVAFSDKYEGDKGM